MSEQSTQDPSLYKLLSETISQHYSSSINSINVPEFSGLPKEDLHRFLDKFKGATIGLSDELRCQALKKSLQGTAKIWAKSHIKELINQGNWKTIKDLLVDRFGEPDRTLQYRIKLNRMCYNEAEITLQGYVEAFVACYKKAYVDHNEIDAIQTLQVNLPPRIIGHLNYLDDKWTEYQKLDDLYKLIKKLETKILPYEIKPSSNQDQLSETIQNALKEFRDSVTELKKARSAITEKPDKKEIALLERRDSPNGKPWTQHYQQNSSPYKRNYNNRQIYTSPRRFGSSSPNPTKRVKFQDDLVSSDMEGSSVQHKQQELDKLYVANYGKPPRPCDLCGGMHFHRHCPYGNLK